jgi:hypothetical protein
MTASARIATSLDERLDGLPSVPPEHYLAAGRTAVRRRRRRRAGVAVGVVAGAIALASTLPLSAGPQQAREHPPAVATRAPAPTVSLSSLAVEPGLGAIDAFTTDEIPRWAQEYGNHGPASIAPDGRLWIAPDATVVRSIADPLGRLPGTHSYAVESRGWASADGSLGGDEPVWSFVYQEDGDTGAVGTVDEPGRWTTDFGLWADDYAASVIGRPSFAERLAAFADDRSDELVPGVGVEVVAQRPDADIGDRPLRARQTVAEVRLDGQTWFLLVVGKQTGEAEYSEAYDEASSGATDLDGFLRFLVDGAS